MFFDVIFSRFNKVIFFDDKFDDVFFLLDGRHYKF